MTPVMESQEILQAIDQLREQISRLTLRLEQLEAAAPKFTTPEAKPEAAAEPPAPTLSPETVRVIAAAVAAFLGKRGHIRHIRLITSTPWAQQGRVSIQASHQLDSYHA